MMKVLIILIAVYIIVCVLLFFFQEKLIFYPEKLGSNHKFDFNQQFEEVSIQTKDSKLLHGLLFRSDSSKGLIFYLHGNAGSVASWGEVAKTYSELQYDVFMVDYRGFGKSQGSISSQEQLYHDLQNLIHHSTAIIKQPIKAVLFLGGCSRKDAKAQNNFPQFLIPNS